MDKNFQKYIKSLPVNSNTFRLNYTVFHNFIHLVSQPSNQKSRESGIRYSFQPFTLEQRPSVKLDDIKWYHRAQKSIRKSVYRSIYVSKKSFKENSMIEIVSSKRMEFFRLTIS